MWNKRQLTWAIINCLLETQGYWGDGTWAQDISAAAAVAAENPDEYGIPLECWVAAAWRDEITATLALRQAFGLPPFC